ncbi:predicted protein [Nematostella vectensis]|uniref:Ataxin-2 C-terminal domain-containing protein n=1 Tax=Nematostella vectensis TaxID=45351 RepID=A7SX57_NEMVE|nr:predicted protein [Nematostella vectensis]|eukprot:XP_001623806.1 predicted protein [Nematostella vectensis]
MEKQPKNNEPNPFEDYMWMENMEDFDRQIEEQLIEEEFIRNCIEQLLEDEEERETMSATEIIAQQKFESMKISNPSSQVPQQQRRNVSMKNNSSGYPRFDAYSQRVLSNSKLNPNAKVFVPGVKTA